MCLRKIPLASFSGSLVRCECGVSIFLANNGRLVASLEGQNPELVPQASEPKASQPKALGPEEPKTPEESAMEVDGPSVVNPLEISIDVAGPSDPKGMEKSNAKDTEEPAKTESYQRRNRNRTPLLWTGAAMVAFFFVALVFVLTRTPPGKAEASKANNTPAPVISKPPAKLQRGTFERLIAEAPAPTVVNEAAMKPEVRSQAESGSEENPKTKPNVPGFRKVPAPSPVSAPDLSPARTRLKIPDISFRGSIFMDLFDQAYEQYEVLLVSPKTASHTRKNWPAHSR